MLGKLSLVMVAGLPGTGKTTLSQALGKRLSWIVLHADTIKYTLSNSGMSKENAARMAYDVLFALTKDVLVHQKKSLILDSTARHLFAIERATELAHVSYAQLKVIHCTVSQNDRYQRLEKRTERILHPTNKAFNGDLEYRQLYQHLPAHTLILDTAQSLEKCVIEAHEYISLEI